MKFTNQYKTPNKVIASFASECGECGWEIDEGDEISFVDDLQEWCHYDCAVEAQSMEGT